MSRARKILATLTLLAPLLAPLTACMKDPKLTPDFGPEVTGEDYVRALVDVETPDPYTIQKGEFAYFTTETYLEGRLLNLDRRWAYTVTNKIEETNDYLFTYLRELREYSGGQEKISFDESSARLAKQRAFTPAAKVQALRFQSPVGVLAESLFANAEARVRATSEAEPEPRRSFHNLRTTRGFFPTPDFVQSRPDCGGKPAQKCKDPLAVVVLSYDMVDWDRNQKYFVEWLITKEVPYFASTRLDLAQPEANFPGVVRSCVSTTMPIQGTRYRVTQCDELKDFTFGSATE